MILSPHDKGKDKDQLPLLFAQVLGSEGGARIIRHLQGMTLNQATGPHVTDTHLRHLEGQRYIVKYIIHQIEKGRS